MKYVLVTGGVVSGIGKGVTASSIGVVLKACGLRVDLDLGNYERFLDIKLTRDNNITTGKIYQVKIAIVGKYTGLSDSYLSVLKVIIFGIISNVFSYSCP
ncbi:hypothetical protein BHE74_00000832 [Ensete ventricosum]|nr:hypothetical protein BHE74_00000832 [Ensete ventricosum]